MRTGISFQRKKSRLFDRSLRFPISFFYFLIFITFIFQTIYFNHGFTFLPTFKLIIFIFGFSVYLILELIEWVAYPRRLSSILATLFTGIRIIIYFLLNYADPTGTSSSLIGYILYTLCFYINPIIVLPILILVLIVFYPNISQFWIRDDVSVGYIYEEFSFILFYLFGVIVRLDNRTRCQNKNMINQLESFASNSLAFGRQEERNRISRDLHDSLGHQLVAVNIQLQKVIAYRQINPEESVQSIKNAQNAADEAIKQLRNTLKGLREIEEENNFIQEIELNIQNVRQNGLEIACEITGNPILYTDLSLFTLKIVIQESLTNIIRHAKASHVDIKIAFEKNGVKVNIKDNGVGFSVQNFEKKDHFGLIGMHERLDLIGGKLKIISKPGSGTELAIDIPNDFFNKWRVNGEKKY